MPRRIFSPKVLEFNVPLKALRQGRPGGTNKEMLAAGEKERNSKDVYINALKTYAKINVLEQGWEMNGTDAIYIIAVINICPTKHVYCKKSKLVKTPQKNCVVDMGLIRSRKLSINKPDIDTYSKIIFKALHGIVFERTSQVVAMTVLRMYNVRDGLDLLVGAASDWKELIHDLRNA